MSGYNNTYGGYGSYSFPNYSRDFNEQYGRPQTPYNPMMTPPQPQPNGNYYYVNGIEGAKAFIVPPNQSAILFDSDSNKLFIKTANQQGQAVLKQFEYNEVVATPPTQQPQPRYVTMEEFEEFKKIYAPTKKEVKKDV